MSQRSRVIVEFVLSWVIILVALALFYFGFVMSAIYTPLVGMMMVAAAPIMLFLWFRK